MAFIYTYTENGKTKSTVLPDSMVEKINKSNAKKKTITIKVKCKIDTTVYVIDRQAMIKTYISRIVLKQWFTDDGKKKNKTTYCIPDDEVGEQSEKTKFVADDFGKIIFTSYNKAAKKFKKLSKYRRNNEKKTGDPLIEDDSITPWEEDVPEPTEDEPILEEVEVEDDLIDGETPKPEPLPDPQKNWISVEETLDPAKYDPTGGDRSSYYDSTGKKVTLNSDGSFIGAKGDIIKVNYYDSNGNTIIHKGKYLGKGSYIYEDGMVVPKGVKILRYMELYGNASVKDGIQIQPDKYGEVPDNIDVEDLDTDIGD